jgi:hypothetical protein
LFKLTEEHIQILGLSAIAFVFTSFHVTSDRQGVIITSSQILKHTFQVLDDALHFAQTIFLPSQSPRAQKKST